jgi:hypothetical protein
MLSRPGRPNTRPEDMRPTAACKRDTIINILVYIIRLFKKTVKTDLQKPESNVSRYKKVHAAKN